MSVYYPAPVAAVSAQSSGSAASVTTAGITTVNGSLLVALIACEGAHIGGTPITDSKSNTWVNAVATASGDSKVALWYVANCIGGASHTFTFTPTSSDFVAIGVINVTQAALTSVIGSTNSTVATSATHASGNITSSTNEIWIGGGGIDHTNEVSGSGTPWITEPFMRVLMLPATATQEGFVMGLRCVSSGVTGQFTWNAAASQLEASIVAAFVGATVSGGSSAAAYAFA